MKAAPPVEPPPVVIPPVVNPPTTGSLSIVATATPPGTWSEVSTANINVGLYDPLSQNTGMMMHYCNSAPWNAKDNTIDFVGADHGGGPALTRYHNATNNWDNFIRCSGSHGYQFLAADRDGGIYHIDCGQNGLYKWDGAEFQRLADGPEQLTQLIAHTPIVWWDGPVAGFPSGCLVTFSSNPGLVSFFDMQAKMWAKQVQVSTGQNGYYHTVSAYSKRFNCLVFGGGAGYSNSVTFVPDNHKLWRMDEDLTVTPMAEGPHHIGIYSGMNLVAGPDGMIYCLGFGEHWKLDPRGAGTWTSCRRHPQRQYFPNDHDAVFGCCTPYGVVYVGGRRISGAPDIRMHVYVPTA